MVVIAALAFAAPGLAIADDHKPPSFTDLTANDPPADTFHDPPGLPPGLGGSVPPGCSVLAADKDDRNGLNGDDKNPGHGNGRINRMSLLPSDYFDASFAGATQVVRIASFQEAKIFARRWVIRDKEPALKALLRRMEQANSSASADSAIRELKQALACRGMLVTTSPLSTP